jgi:hypothetical protein
MYGDNENVKMFATRFYFDSRCLKISMLTQFIQGVMSVSTCDEISLHEHNVELKTDEASLHNITFRFPESKNYID